MAIFSGTDAIAVLGLAAFNYVQFARSPMNARWYESGKPRWGPPSWLFPLAWFLLYAMTTVAGYYFFKMVPDDSWQLVAGFTLYAVHMVANKMWSVFFWSGMKRGPLLALIILVAIMLPTGIAFVVIAGIDRFDLFAVPVTLFSIYMAWLLYATALNIHWVNRQ